MELELSLRNEEHLQGCSVCDPPSTVKLDEENPKYAGLLKKMVLAQHNCTACHVW
jgi:hypothetical protein